MPIPPPPPGFQIVSGGGGTPATGGRPILRRGRDPQSMIVQDGQIINPNTGTASPIAGFTPKLNSKTAEERELDQVNLLLKRQELADKKAKQQQAGSPQDVAAEIRNVMDSAFRAKELSRDGWFATGAGAGLAGKFGGTSASNVKGLLDTIGANTAFSQLQKMREASPTGAALGSITERELALLQSTIASLDPNQSDEQFQGAMQNIANAYGRILQKIPGGRAMMIERGWLPKSGGAQPKAQPKKQPKGRVINFNDLPE